MAWLTCTPACTDPTHWELVGKRTNIVTAWKPNGTAWTPGCTVTTTTTKRHRGLTSDAALAMISTTITTAITTIRRAQRDGGNGYSVIEEVTQ